ncbi:hypothetical protein GW764_01725 [Candidatus Parcubacteria bacterium]|nr:hypothetical protein [Candidatus Parcubacteria bacterium]
MNRIFLNNYNYICEILIEDNTFFDEVKESEFWKVYCPDISISDSDSKLESDIQVLVGDKFSEMFFDIRSKIEIPIIELSVEDLITVIDYIYEPQRNINGVYTINSSSVVNKDNQGVIFFGGATGMGKTSLARYFDSKKYFNIFSDDKTLLNLRKLKILNGSSYLYVNKSNLKKEFKSNINSHKKFNNNTEIQADLALFVYGYLQKSFKEKEVWPDDKFCWHLYESLTKRIRGVSRRIIGGKIPLPSIDSKYLSEQRIKDINYLCSNTKCLFIKSSYRYAYKNINKIIKK